MRDLKEQVKLVVQSVVQHHLPSFTTGSFSVNADDIDPWCTGCDGLVSWKKCPTLKAAKELEEAYEGD
jgi:hypothetical protein